MIQSIVRRAIETGKGCSREEALALSRLDEAELFAGATRLREAFFGRFVRFCAILNAKSGRCDMNCAFCSQSASADTSIETYPLLPEKRLVQGLRELMATDDCRASLVTGGGKLSDDDVRRVANVARTLSPAPLCASLGRLSREALGELLAAGIARFHHNLETSERFYPEICTTQSWRERRKVVETARAVGLDVCSGGLFGLGETWEDRIDLALVLRDLGVDSVPINFLYAHPGTRLADLPPLSPEEALRIVALYRFLLPNVTLRICGGRLHVLAERQIDLFAAGANGLMTGNYLTVSGSQYETDRRLVRDAGLTIDPKAP